MRLVVAVVEGKVTVHTVVVVVVVVVVAVVRMDHIAVADHIVAEGNLVVAIERHRVVAVDNQKMVVAVCSWLAGFLVARNSMQMLMEMVTEIPVVVPVSFRSPLEE